jgi:hypothetical protein
MDVDTIKSELQALSGGEGCEGSLDVSASTMQFQYVGKKTYALANPMGPI